MATNNSSVIQAKYLVRIRGPMACFTRPEFKTERVSYDVITPAAARGAIEAVLWKPAIAWSIRKIMLLAPPKWMQFKRNEVNSRCSIDISKTAMRTGERPDYYADEDRAQRNTVALRDVDYAVEAHFHMTERTGPEDNPRKFDEMFRRRLEKGQYHMQPYLGCREFPAVVEPYDGTPAPLPLDQELGLMLHDIRYSPMGNRPVFFEARMKSGVIEVPDWGAS